MGHFVKDEKTRFGLALECGNLEVAEEAAKAMDDKTCWEKLGQAALLQGSHNIVEKAYQRTKNMEKLQFFYLITGNLEKLRKMMKIAEVRKDHSAHYQSALYLGDVEERVKILKNVGQKSLALLTAETHGLTETAEELKTLFNEGENIPQPNPNAVLLQPPIPLTKNRDQNWPLLMKQKGIFDTVGKSTTNTLPGTSTFDFKGTDDVDVQNNWSSDDDVPFDENGEVMESKTKNNEDAGDEDGPGWGGSDDEDIFSGSEQFEAEPVTGSGYVPPQKGISQANVWTNGGGLVYDRVAAGAFDDAFRLMSDQVGIVKYEQFKEMFMNIYSGSRTCFVAMPGLPPLIAYPHRNHATAGLRNGKPQTSLHLSDLVSSLQEAYKLITLGKFPDAIEKFRKILLSVPLLVVDTKQQIQEAQQLIGIARNYIVGFSMEIERKKIDKSTLEGQKRICEMSAYITHCELQPSHLILTLKSASNLMFKLKNYKMAQTFAKRLLELGPKSDLASHARKIISASDRNLIDSHDLNYDGHNPFDLCAASYT